MEIPEDLTKEKLIDIIKEANDFAIDKFK